MLQPKIRTALLYAQDRRGLGHINRTLIIARTLLANHPELVAYVATKSAIGRNFDLPERCDYVKLPTILTPRTVQRTDEEREAAERHFRHIRSEILRDAALGLEPDLVLVDHEPLGIKGEFREGLYALKERRPDTKFVFGLRDIMDDPAGIRALWQELRVYDALEGLYDGIAVYGSPELYDVEQAYAIPASVGRKLHYCGYVVRDRPAVDAMALRRQYGLPAKARVLLATVGGGSDGYPVLESAEKAVEQLQREFPELVAILVTGPFMPPEQQAELQTRATACCRVVSSADTFALMTLADAVVSMGGYNSVCEALAAETPLVIVPRETHKIEQAIRAEMLASRGLAWCVHPKELCAESLAESVSRALRCERQAYVARLREVLPSFEGAARLSAYLSRWLG